MLFKLYNICVSRCGEDRKIPSVLLNKKYRNSQCSTFFTCLFVFFSLNEGARTSGVSKAVTFFFFSYQNQVSKLLKVFKTNKYTKFSKSALVWFLTKWASCRGILCTAALSDRNIKILSTLTWFAPFPLLLFPILNNFDNLILTLEWQPCYSQISHTDISVFSALMAWCRFLPGDREWSSNKTWRHLQMGGFLLL